ncbi:HTH domain-containing protein (plasmid) [Halorientalis pallida]|uniref:HTH domain-containing protein n=1 Tax=Halorientalis pallida TaxID=2479928 RepID=UPI003C6EC13A
MRRFRLWNRSRGIVSPEYPRAVGSITRIVACRTRRITMGTSVERPDGPIRWASQLRDVPHSCGAIRHCPTWGSLPDQTRHPMVPRCRHLTRRHVCESRAIASFPAFVRPLATCHRSRRPVGGPYALIHRYRRFRGAFRDLTRGYKRCVPPAGRSNFTFGRFWPKLADGNRSERSRYLSTGGAGYRVTLDGTQGRVTMRRSSDQASEWWNAKTRSLRSGHPPRIEVFLRSFAPPIGVREQQEAVLERLADLERQGVVETVSVDIWGKAVCPEGHCGETHAGERILDRIDEFRGWAADAEVSVESPFEERFVTSTTTDEQFLKIVLPRLCLGVYVDDDLRLVLPCQLEDETISVESFLSALESAPRAERIGTSA